MAATDLFVSVGGVARATGHAGTGRVLWEGIGITDIVDETPNRMQFTAMGFTPTVGQRVIAALGAITNDRLFAGTILSVDQVYVADNPVSLNQQWRAHCIDNTWLLRKRVVTGFFTGSATTIVQSLMSTYAPDFTVVAVVAALPTVDGGITFTNQDLPHCLTQISKRIGGYWYLDYLDDLHFFLSETGDDPDDLTATGYAHDLDNFSITRDLSQVVTRALVEGGGANAYAEVVAGETILPVEDASWYEATGGTVLSGPQRITYTGILSASGGALVGPGAAPSSAPTLAAAGGSGVESGAHDYAATFVTASGESIASPVSSITVGVVAAPISATVAGAPTSGGSVTAGTHQYGVTYVTAAGETTASALSNQITAGVIAAPSTAPTFSNQAGGSIEIGTAIRWYVTYITAGGETTGTITGSNASTAAGFQQFLLSSIPIGPAGVTGRRLYRTDSPFGNSPLLVTTIADNTTTTYTDGAAYSSLGAALPGTNTTLMGTVALTVIPISPSALVTSRKVYRTAAAGSQLKLLTTIANNTASTFSDTLADGSLGANVPTTNTAVANQVALTNIPIGAAAVTSRKIYRTVAAGSQLKLLTTIANNTATTYTDSTADASLGANVPTTDTSALAQPDGQVIAGATSLPVAGTAGFSATGGWAVIGNGTQVIRYTGYTGSALTGVPATSPGAIVAAVGYNSNVTSAPSLTGVPSSGAGSILYTIPKGQPVNLFVTVNDVSAQSVLGALLLDEGGSPTDGIHEAFIQDRRLSFDEATARGEAYLALYSSFESSISYTCRDPNTKAGRTIGVNLASPTSVVADFKIQQVNLSFTMAKPPLYPLYTVQASTTRFSFEDLLRQVQP